MLEFRSSSGNVRFAGSSHAAIAAAVALPVPGQEAEPLVEIPAEVVIPAEPVAPRPSSAVMAVRSRP